MSKPNIGITVGDINGISLEVILKALSHPGILNMCTPVIYGSSKVVSYHKNIIEADHINFYSVKTTDRLKWDRINVFNCWQEEVSISLGKQSEDGGKYAKISLLQAAYDLEQGNIDAVVTGPINKKAMKMAGFGYPGHTEFFSEKAGVKTSLMVMVHEDIKVALATNHVPIEEVKSTLTKAVLKEKLELFNKTLIRDFGIEKPVIAVLGLNPHAGDDGVIGNEEEEVIRPVIVQAKKNGIMAMGPYAADGFFGSGQYRKVHGILAMYHDQGLIPFKLLSFGEGVNYTAGLPFVRTSPDHGTAYDIAGKNEADGSSFRQAIFKAIDVVKNRADFKDMHSDPLRAKAELTEEEVEGD
ncbi:MAG: 4-hydroxythreonine-4-phosphate dehydrogenase PdxA [Saprospiraceae bacterium]|nr:4-hydroxythreonine-4-phosphate dehydrogenase PdxA [Saprospiraceae bacterium]